MHMQRDNSAVIAMSGEVDSSVAAYLMTENGYRCMGATMRLFRNPDIGICSFYTCCSQKDIDDASDVAFTLNIPYEVLDFTAGFKEKIPTWRNEKGSCEKNRRAARFLQFWE